MLDFDRLLTSLLEFQGVHVTFTQGRQSVVMNAAGERMVSVRAVSKAELEALLRDSMSPEAEQKLRLTGRCEFDYASSLGQCSVTVLSAGGNLRVELTVSPQEATQAETLLEHDGAANDADAETDQAEEALVVFPRRDYQLDELVSLLVSQRASDLHLASDQPPYLRRDGDMLSVPDAAPIDAGRMRLMLDAILPDKNRHELDELHDTDFGYEVSGLRCRANIFVDRRGLGAVFRLIPSTILTVRDLALPPHVVELCTLKRGLVLVTGPTGSGKTTTLSALVDHINATSRGHILTIEDPIEVVHACKRCLVTQREVGVHADSFKRALRAALREDPDVVMVGEMRDLETVHIALEMAETGHLVLGTLHTNTAAATVDRIIDQFPSGRQPQIRTMLSESLKAVISQVLCKRVGGGRVAAYETMIVTRSISNLIREGKTFQIQSAMQTGRAQGMTTLNAALCNLVKCGLVTAEEAFHHAIDKAELKQLIDVYEQHSKLVGEQPAAA